MESLKDNSAARVCLLFTKLSWYSFLIIGSLAPVTFVLAYLDQLPEQLNFDLTPPLSTGVVELTPNIDQAAVTLDSVKAQLDIAYFAQQFPDVFISSLIFVLILLAMILTGLYQLKILLQEALNDNVFTR